MNLPLPRLSFAIPVMTLLLAACTTTASPSASSATPSATPTEQATASASASAEPTASESAEASASAPAVVDPDGFTVVPHAEADALFLDRDECENPEDGYRLEFPEAWYTNTEIGNVPPCSWFSPTFFEVDDPDQVPAEIAITIELVDGGYGFLGRVTTNEEVTIGATQDAVRAESEDEPTASGENVTAYVYVVQLGPTPEEGPNLVVRTTTASGGDYELNKAVLDRIMATMEFIGTVQ
jgi:hypothetical protein